MSISFALSSLEGVFRKSAAFRTDTHEDYFKAASESLIVTSRTRSSIRVPFPILRVLGCPVFALHSLPPDRGLGSAVNEHT